MLLQTALETGAELGVRGRHERIAYVVSGEPKMRVGKEAHFLGPGDRVLVPPQVRHGGMSRRKTAAMQLSRCHGTISNDG
jgi:quercetin dioxygenase-like cupin family protein